MYLINQSLSFVEDDEEEEDRTLATTPENELEDKEKDSVKELTADFNTNDMMLLRKKLEEVRYLINKNCN